jgi:hypothetical protein
VKVSSARALLIAVLALVVLAPAVPAVADRLPTETRLHARKSRAQKEQAQPKKSGSSESNGQKKQAKEGEKKQDTEVTADRGTLDPIGVLARGQTVEIRGTALRTGELCALQVFYTDKPAKVIRDVVPDEKKRCVFSVPIPDRPGVVGEGKAKLILTKATSGKKSGEARQVFSVQ